MVLQAPDAAERAAGSAVRPVAPHPPRPAPLPIWRPPAHGRTAPARPVRLEQLPFSLFRIDPPYEAATPVARAGALNVDQLRLGCLLGVEVPGTLTDWEQVRRTVQQLHQSAPVIPLVLRLAPGADSALAVRRSTRLPVRGVLLHADPLRETLRLHLTQPIDLAADVVDWLTMRGLRLSPSNRFFIQKVFERAPRHHELSPLLRELGLAESSARFRLHKKRLPTPGRWFQTARAVHAALRLQADPARSLLSLALEFGYTDHSALSHQLNRTFRIRPAEIRRRLGWEWLLDRWLAFATPR